MKITIVSRYVVAVLLSLAVALFLFIGSAVPSHGNKCPLHIKANEHTHSPIQVPNPQVAFTEQTYLPTEAPNPQVASLGLQEIPPGRQEIFLLSAFFDERAWRFYSTPIVTIIGILHRNSFALEMSCLFYLNSSQVMATSAYSMENPEHHFLDFRIGYIHCNLDSFLNEKTAEEILEELGKIKTVTVGVHGQPIDLPTAAADGDLNFPGVPINPQRLGILSDETVVDRCGICIAPLRDDIYSESIATFVEHHRNLTNSDTVFMFYNTSAGVHTSAQLRSLMRESETIKIVDWSLKPASFPDLFSDLFENLHYNGQVAAINDCLFRMIGTAKWVGIIDLDEFLIGRCSQALNLHSIFDLANSMHPPEEVGFRFLSAHFYNNCTITRPVSRYPIDSSGYRGDWFPDRIRTKTFVDPMLVYMQGVHETWRYVNEYEIKPPPLNITLPVLVTVSVPEEIAAIHHFQYFPVEERYAGNCTGGDGLFFDDAAFAETLKDCAIE